MQIDIDLQRIIDKVKAMLDEEVIKEHQRIHEMAPKKMKERKKAEKELAAQARKQLSERGQLEEFLRKAGIYDEESCKDFLRKIGDNGDDSE